MVTGWDIVFLGAGGDTRSEKHYGGGFYAEVRHRWARRAGDVVAVVEWKITGPKCSTKWAAAAGLASAKRAADKAVAEARRCRR